MAKTDNQQGIIKSATETKAASKKQTMTDLLNKMMPEIQKALPKVITPERFTRIALTALSSNATLMECEPKSFLGALMQAAQLGLEPNTPLGQAYLIPFKNNTKGIIECQFQIGYKGLLDLAHRSGEVQNIQAYCVYENDSFDYELGLDPVLKHKPATENRGKLTFVYAVYKLVNGGYGFEVMSIDDINQHAQKYSQAVKQNRQSPWKSNFEEMSKKTVLKKVLKYAPIKTEFLQAVSVDEKVARVEANDFANMEMVYAEQEDIDVVVVDADESQNQNNNDPEQSEEAKEKSFLDEYNERKKILEEKNEEA